MRDSLQTEALPPCLSPEVIVNADKQTAEFSKPPKNSLLIGTILNVLFTLLYFICLFFYPMPEIVLFFFCLLQLSENSTKKIRLILLACSWNRIVQMIIK